MPPENSNPVTKSETNEFDFESAKTENPRIRKRSLKSKSSAQAAAPIPPSAQVSRPAITPDQPRAAVYAQPAAAPSQPQPTYVRPSTGEPVEKPQSAPATGVLYYSNSPQKDAGARTTPTAAQPTRPVAASTQPAPHRPATKPMQTPSHLRPASTSHSAPTRPASTGHAASSHSIHTPQMSTSRPISSVASTPQSSPSRPASGTTSTGATRAVSTAVASPSAASRPAGVSDYRGNIDRQSREAKSIGGILNIIVYGLIGLFVIAGLLAAYGANDVYKQLHAQSTTVTELDSRYSKANQDLGDQIKSTQQAVIQMQTQLNRTQELAVRQQDTIGKLQAALDAETEALRQERATRAAETSIRISENSALRARIHSLEEKNESPYHP
jgi:hypothetical protein